MDFCAILIAGFRSSLVSIRSFVFCVITFQFYSPPAFSQVTIDRFLQDLLLQHASPLLKNVLAKPDSFHYQLIYTKIDRDRKNKPHFTHYRYRVTPDDYFNPASMVKLPVAVMALEKVRAIGRPVTKFSPMITDSAYSRQTKVLKDSTAQNGYPSVAHYVNKIFYVSDNDAYNRLYEYNGQQYMNERLWKMGYNQMRITRRFVTMSEEENRHTNPIHFLNRKGEISYTQPAAFNTQPFDFSKKILIGKAHYNREEKLVDSPMDFTTHNNAPLENLQQILQSVLFPNSVPRQQRFNLGEEDYGFLYTAMSTLPTETTYPKYDTTEFFGSYTKFFMFKSGRTSIPSNIRVFNKTGWSYGFLTDVAYIVDFEKNIEFMLSGTIYVNADGVLNDDKYEYESIGYPFFKEVGNIIYEYELKRERKYQPDLTNFKSLR